jgi:hypothetical protein
MRGAALAGTERARQIETEAAPTYVAELIGAGIDSGQAIRWPVALMTLCCPAGNCVDGRNFGASIDNS